MTTTDPTTSTQENSPTLRRHYMKLQSLRIILLENRNGHSTRPADSLTDDGAQMTDHHPVPAPSIGILSLEQNALAELNAACQRILDGTYGICEITGKPISESRLRIAPWTRYGAEANQRIQQRHLRQPTDSDTG